MKEKFEPKIQPRFVHDEDVIGEKDRAMVEELAKSHGRKGGHTISSTTDAGGELRKTTFSEKEEEARANTESDRILGKLVRRQKDSSQKHLGEILPDPGYEDWENDYDNRDLEEPGGFLQENPEDKIKREQEEAQKKSEVFKLAGFEEIKKLVKLLSGRKDKLREDLKDREVYKQDIIDKKIKKIEQEENMITGVVALIVKDLPLDDKGLASGIGHDVGLFLKLIMERIAIEPEEEQELDIYDKRIAMVKELINIQLKKKGKQKEGN